MIGIKIRMPKNCQTCKLSMSNIESDYHNDYHSLYEECTCIVKEKSTKYLMSDKKKHGRPKYCPLQQMSIEEKMANAKESHLFDGLSEEDKFEAVLAGKLAVALIKELEKIEAEIKEEQLPRDNPYNKHTEYSVSMDEIRKIFDKHMSSI